MTRHVLLLAVAAQIACGRLGYDSLAVSSDDAPSDAQALPVDATSDGLAIDAAGDGAMAAVCSGDVVALCPSVSGSIGPGMNLHVSAKTTGLGDGRSGTCGGTGSAELILELDVAQFGFYDISTDGSDFDTVVYVIDNTCDGAEFDCIDAVVGSGGENLTVGFGHAGLWYVVVDGVNGCGNVELDIQG